MWKVEFDSQPIMVKHINGKNGKEGFDKREQIAYLHQGGKYPLTFHYPLDKDQAPFPAGFYELLPTSAEVDQYKGLTFRRQYDVGPMLKS